MKIARFGPVVLLAGSCAAQPALPFLIVTTDDTIITESCRVVIPAGTVIEDTNGNGVIQITADGVTVEFVTGSELIGTAGLERWRSTGGGAWDRLTGTGIVIDGATDVTVSGAVVRGYKVGIRARAATGLTVQNAEITDTFHTPLRSTPAAEDTSDWLRPHNNDGGEWLARYGAALAIKGSERVEVRGVRVRRSQNGIVLDRVNKSRVYDNDCSYLSGWGIAMWRSSFNTVSRNALDYNVRGHSEGVYNRGQDSAGLLMFEQCRSNMILENSATHCGDGIFAFAGIEAIGQAAAPAGGIDYLDAGNNDNLFLGNDLSHNSAHGLELTFSENNIIAGNRFVSNAICGIWGGYSSGVRVHSNEFSYNGGRPYGAERGGINAEHASGWVIDSNTFVNDRAAIHFWTDRDEELQRLAGVSVGYRGVDGNAIVRNRFVMNREHPFGDDVVLYGVHARRVVSSEQSRGKRFGTNWMMENTFEIEDGAGEAVLNSEAEFETPGGTAEDVVWFGQIPSPEVFGQTRPTERVNRLAGRGSIVMGPWRAWEMEQPMFRVASRSPGVHVFELFVPEGWADEVAVQTLAGPEAAVSRADNPTALDPYVITAESEARTVVTVAGIRVSAGDGFERTSVVPLIRVAWEARVWEWKTDPMKDRAGWVAEGDAVGAVTLGELDLAFGSRGPSAANPALPIEAADRFGVIAQTRVTLPAGRWRLATVSDDGIRVLINGETVVDRWDIHGPTPDGAVFVSDGAGPTSIRVEYFELDGHAALRVELVPG